MLRSVPQIVGPTVVDTGGQLKKARQAHGLQWDYVDVKWEGNRGHEIVECDYTWFEARDHMQQVHAQREF